MDRSNLHRRRGIDHVYDKSGAFSEFDRLNPFRKKGGDDVSQQTVDPSLPKTRRRWR